MTRTAAALRVSAATAAVATITAAMAWVSMPGQAAPSAGAKPVTTPIAEPHAWVDPRVGDMMNGKPDKVKLADKIPMHKPTAVPKSLTGNGQGNGCLQGYGEPGQCLPVQSPTQQKMPGMVHPWTCTEVRWLFPDGIKVHGRDTLGLDANANRTMCDQGDG